MNKAAIKNFAIEARKKLIASIKDKAGRIGITKDRITDPISKGEGYAIFPTHIGIEAKLTGKEVKQRENLVNRIKSKENGYELVMEEVAYTWFNRLIAIRFMEVNDYLTSRVRVLSSETEGKYEPDIVTQAPDVDLEFSQAEIEEILTLKEKNVMDQLFRMLFIKQCNELGKILPELFENTSKENNDYTEILLDISYTSEDGILRDLLKIDEADFLEAVEIIGWLYQYYNTELNELVYDGTMSREKIPKELLPAATQLFTPDWPVRYMVENSLGRLWLGGHPDNLLKTEWKFYLDEPQDANIEYTSVYKDIRPEEIKVIDPCMGSGHILAYAFDVLMRIYESCGYTQRDAARTILENNLYGLDIDDRAYQLAYFALMMKGRKYDRKILTRGIVPNLCSIQESNGLSCFEYGSGQLQLNQSQKEAANYLINVFKEAKEYGSIINVKAGNYSSLLRYIEELQMGGTGDLFTSAWFNDINKTLPSLIKQANIMTQKYDVVITNPPYLGNGRMNYKLSEYVAEHFDDVKTDFSMVMYRKSIDSYLKQGGYVSFITTTSWMFLKSFESIRKHILKNFEFETLVDFGTELFDGKVGHNPIVAWVNKHSMPTKPMVAVRLVDYCYSRRNEKLLEFFNHKNKYISKQSDFSKIPGCPIAYWVSSNIISLFETAAKLKEISRARSGAKTGKNELFLRLWWEVESTKFSTCTKSYQECLVNGYKWFPHNKGGEYRNWYGNNEIVVNFYQGGKEIKEYGDINKCSYDLSAKDVYFKEGVTWTALTSGKNSFRYSPSGFVFDTNKGPMIFDNGQNIIFYLLGFFISPIAQFIMKVTNPSLSLQNGDMDKLPIIIDKDKKNIIARLVEENIKISRQDWDSFETSWDFKKHSLIKCKNDGFSKLKDAFRAWKIRCENRFKQLKENQEKINHMFIEIYSLQQEIKPEIEDKEVTIWKSDFQRDIRSFISYAVGCMFGRYSLDTEGLAYAGGVWDISTYTTFVPDADNILPITDEEYFTDDIVVRFVEFVKAVYGQDALEENLDFIAEALNNKGTTSREIIRNYFLKDFYADHVRVYQKRPIYWLFDSGKENGFKALSYMHRYDQDTVGRVRVDYLHKAQAFIENAIANCEVVRESNAPANEKAKAVKQKEKLVKQLAKTRLYDQAIAHIAHQRIAIDLDDGVVVNYAKFQGVEVANEGKKAVKIDLLVKI